MSPARNGWPSLCGTQEAGSLVATNCSSLGPDAAAAPANDCAPRVACLARAKVALPPSDAGRFIGDLLLASCLLCASGGGGTRAPHRPAFVRRRINSDTYLRRMFVTEKLASLIGLDAVVALLPGHGWGGASAPKIDVTVLDAHGRVCPCAFTMRKGSTVTGQLGGEWRAFCAAHYARVGHAVVFERAPPGWQGRDLAVCARVV